MLFSGCRNLNYAATLILPATTLADSCYSSMFYNCTSLTSFSANLFSTTLPDSCYANMFNNCTSLSELVDNFIWATNFSGKYCCQNMFYNCNSLATYSQTTRPTSHKICYFNSISGDYATHNMFYSTKGSITPSIGNYVYWT